MTIDEIIERLDKIAVYQEFEYGKETFDMYMHVIDMLKELKVLRQAIKNCEKTSFIVNSKEFAKIVNEWVAEELKE